METNASLLPQPVCDQPAQDVPVVTSPDQTPSAGWSAAMFTLALAWLMVTGGALHIFESDGETPLFWICTALLTALWPIFLIDVAQRLRAGAKNRIATCFCVLLPALRLGLRDSVTATRLWLPKIGWQTVNLELYERVEKGLRGPMLIVSLTVLPLITAEYLAADFLAARPALRQATIVATALIWWAFTCEFILMVSITDKKLKYVKEHWLDLVIILLPLVAFLRMLRLSRLARLQQLTKTSRVFRFRGVAMKTYRALLLVDAVSRLLQGAPEKRLVKLRQRLIDQEAEVAALRREIAALESQIVITAEPLLAHNAPSAG